MKKTILALITCPHIGNHGINAADKIPVANPDGVSLSDIPGDSAVVRCLVQAVKKLIGKVPIFGICPGHRMLGQALGGKTSRIKFGHHGNNHSVMDLKSRRIGIAFRNHGFVTDIDLLPKDEAELTHTNLNDKSLGGLARRKCPPFRAQYHPENASGPHDNDYLFSRFYKLTERNA
jgi:carbamoyl-phosphate synthase small subunit